MAKNKDLSLDLNSKKEPVVEEAPKKAAPAKEEKPKTVKVANCLKLNVRAEASMDAKVLTVVDKDTELVLKNKLNADWSRIVTKNGVEGFVMNSFITK